MVLDIIALGRRECSVHNRESPTSELGHGFTALPTLAAARQTAQNGCQICRIIVGGVDSFTEGKYNDSKTHLKYSPSRQPSLLEVWLAEKEEEIHLPSMIIEFHVKGSSICTEESND